MPADDRNLLFWTDRLFGLPISDLSEAIEFVRALEIPTLTAELVDTETADAVIACYFLQHAWKVLGRYMAESKLRKKLRSDPEVWSAWCELRTAALLVERAPDGTRVEMDPGRSDGPQPDLRVVVPGDPGAQSIEIKSIGLSDEEVAFCARMATSLRSFAPNDGFVTVSGLLNDAAPEAPRSARRAHARGGAKRIRAVLPDWPAGVSGASVVLHGADAGYLRRVALRIRDALRQLPPSDECWVAFYWTNGAPMQRIVEFIRWDEIPEYVAGIVFAGTATVFPDRRLHAYQLTVPRGSHLEDVPAFQSFDESEAGRTVGEIIHGLTQNSSGVRATLLRTRNPGRGRRTLLERNGSRRLAPFNLLLDADTPEVRGYLEGRRLGHI